MKRPAGPREVRVPAPPPKLHPTRSPGSLPSGLSRFLFAAPHLGDVTTVEALTWHAARAKAMVKLGVSPDEIVTMAVNGKRCSDG